MAEANTRAGVGFHITTDHPAREGPRGRADNVHGAQRGP